MDRLFQYGSLNYNVTLQGDDLHHGFYKDAQVKDHKAAQVEMIEQALHFGYNGTKLDLSNKSMIDVGCGVGGSSRHIIKKYGGTGEGITLSTFQRNSAESLTEAVGLSNKLHFRIADAMQMPYENSTFDLSKLL
jgi:tocopherol O-methyltransferase